MMNPFLGSSSMASMRRVTSAWRMTSMRGMTSVRGVTSVRRVTSVWRTLFHRAPLILNGSPFRGLQRTHNFSRGNGCIKQFTIYCFHFSLVIFNGGRIFRHFFKGGLCPLDPFTCILQYLFGKILVGKKSELV
jgi:hypothetical protein